MELVLVTLGAVCLVAAVAGVGVKALNVEIAAISSRLRQLLLALLGGAFIVAGIAIGGKSNASGAAFHTTSLPSSTRVIPPASATATSTLQPQDGFTYGVTNLLDDDETTAWCEGANGNGIGESLRFTFSAPVRLRRIDIINGYNKLGRFRVNARAQNLEIGSSEGSGLATLRDTSAVQHLPLPDAATTFVKLTIKSAYPGTQFADLCLTDIRFIGVGGR